VQIIGIKWDCNGRYRGAVGDGRVPVGDMAPSIIINKIIQSRESSKLTAFHPIH